MTRLLVCAELVRARYGYREVLSGVSFDLRRGQALGIVGPAGAGKTTMLRLLAGLLAPAGGTLQIDGRAPHLASRRTAVGYFAGDFTLPGSVRADAWGRLATGTVLTVERRPLRALSRGARQMLGLRATLARERLDLVLLDEPWETLDADGSAWLTSTLLTKRDHGASLVLTSEQHHDLVRVCDVFLVMLHQRGVLVHAHQLNPSGIATAADLDAAIEALRTPGPPLRPVAEAVEAGRAPEVQSGVRLDGTDLSPPSQPG